VDFSPASNHAARYAAEFAQTHGAGLKLLHVIAPVIPNAYEYSVNTADIMNSLEEASERQMRKLVLSLKTMDIRLEDEIVTGDVLSQINDGINTYGPDLVVIGMHSKGILDRIFIGSTAERLVRHASRPVLVIPPEHKAAPKTRPRKRAA